MLSPQHCNDQETPWKGHHAHEHNCHSSGDSEAQHALISNTQIIERPRKLDLRMMGNWGVFGAEFGHPEIYILKL